MVNDFDAQVLVNEVIAEVVPERARLIGTLGDLDSEKTEGYFRLPILSFSLSQGLIDEMGEE
jgi:hypothetical protein